MAGTEGLGGPCPRCGEMNCYIKKGTGTWYTFVACTDCYFAYGEHADNMAEETGGVVSGSTVWASLMSAHQIDSVDEIDDMELEDEQYTVECPFEFHEDDEKWLELLVADRFTLQMLAQAVGTKADVGVPDE